jgi:hypothetical protein
MNGSGVEGRGLWEKSLAPARCIEMKGGNIQVEVRP